MKKLKKKRATAVPLLCWDIYGEYLNIQLGIADAATKKSWGFGKRKKN